LLVYNRAFGGAAIDREMMPGSRILEPRRRIDFSPQATQMKSQAKVSEDPRLTRLTQIALELPGAERKLHGSHAQFLVRKKTFAYFLDNHHGDRIVAVTCKGLPGDNKVLSEKQPRRYYLPADIGPRGWVALRLDIGKIDWNEVRELLLGSYLLITPRKLAEQLRNLL
jgi:predicted DNA-binding protein (MmcQ/YjbR family)